MTTFRSALRSALTEAVGIPQRAPAGSVARPAAPSGSIARVPAGELVELLSECPTACPKCGARLQRPATRRRRLVNVTARGRVLSTEIDP